MTAEAFAPFGVLIEPIEDGAAFGERDARLELQRGKPRFYVMRLHARPLGFRTITRHMQVTQCLASVGGASWMIAVAPPHLPDDASAKPDPEAIRVFAVPGDVAIQLHRSTWHAGPFFHGEFASFFNLEMSDTNEVDHHRCDLQEVFGIVFSIRAD
jgi:ureidoglycolate lyase